MPRHYLLDDKRRTQFVLGESGPWAELFVDPVPRNREELRGKLHAIFTRAVARQLEGGLLAEEDRRRAAAHGSWPLVEVFEMKAARLWDFLEDASWATRWVTDADAAYPWWGYRRVGRLSAQEFEEGWRFLFSRP